MHYSVNPQGHAFFEGERGAGSAELDRLSLPYSDQPAFQAILNQERLVAGHIGSSQS